MRILLVLLCLVAAALYAKILVPELDYADLMPVTTESQPANNTQTAQAKTELQAVPQSQIAVIREVFAPELGQ